MAGESTFLCSICFRTISLEDYKVDEDGRAVHEKCYATRMLHRPASTGKPSGMSLSNVPRWRSLGRKIMRIVGWG